MSKGIPADLIAKIEEYQELNIHAPWVDDPEAIAKDLATPLPEVRRALAIMDAVAYLYEADEQFGTEVTIEELFLYAFPKSSLHGKV